MECDSISENIRNIRNINEKSFGNVETYMQQMYYSEIICIKFSQICDFCHLLVKAAVNKAAAKHKYHPK